MKLDALKKLVDVAINLETPGVLYYRAQILDAISDLYIERDRALATVEKLLNEGGSAVDSSGCLYVDIPAPVVARYQIRAKLEDTPMIKPVIDPPNAAELRAEAWLKAQAQLVGEDFLSALHNVSPEGEDVYEWWSKKRKLTIYVTPAGIETYIKIWGPNPDTEMEDGTVISIVDLFKWLHGKDEPAPQVQHLAVRADFNALLERAKEAKSGQKIVDECLSLAKMLVEKNIAYGDSALNPIRIFAKDLDPRAQLLVRIDDKLSRIIQGVDSGEDAVQDLLGYLVLYRVSSRRGA